MNIAVSFLKQRQREKRRSIEELKSARGSRDDSLVIARRSRFLTDFRAADAGIQKNRHTSTARGMSKMLTNDQSATRETLNALRLTSAASHGQSVLSVNAQRFLTHISYTPTKTPTISKE